MTDTATTEQATATKPELTIEIKLADLPVSFELRDIEQFYIGKIGEAGYDFNAPEERILCHALFSGDVFHHIRESWSTQYQHWFCGGSSHGDRDGYIGCIRYAVGDFEPVTETAAVAAVSEPEPEPEA